MVCAMSIKGKDGSKQAACWPLMHGAAGVLPC